MLLCSNGPLCEGIIGDRHATDVRNDGVLYLTNWLAGVDFNSDITGVNV